jgi:hypothetical protein
LAGLTDGMKLEELYIVGNEVTEKVDGLMGKLAEWLPTTKVLGRMNGGFILLIVWTNNSQPVH